MTREQELKATIAYLDLIWDNALKEHAAKNHCTAAEWVTLYRLPYRVALDYLKHPEAYKGKCRINPCYPLAGFPREEVLTISANDLDDIRCSYEKQDGTRVLTSEWFDTPRPEVQERLNEYNKRFTPAWVDDLNEWERLFACYLIPYDFDTFTLFDMYGRTDGTQAELDDSISYYKGVQERYKQGNYLTEAPPLPPDADKYTDRPFLISFD